MEPEQDEKGKAARVQAEVERMKQLPAASAYAAHRLRVLNKMLHILAINPKVTDANSPPPSPTGSAPARSPRQVDELELLFSGMAF